LDLDPIRILAHRMLGLQGRELDQVRVQYDLYDEVPVTWEDAANLRVLYPHLFDDFQEEV